MMITSIDLKKKKIDIKQISREVIEEPAMIGTLVEAIKTQANTPRYNAFKVLEIISHTHPELLNSHWYQFVNMLQSESVFVRYVAIHMILKLSEKEKTGRLDRIFSQVFALLHGPEFIPAAHLVLSAGKVARANPSLEDKITRLLLSIDTIYTGKNLETLKGHILEAFDDYFEISEEQFQMMDFAKEQLESPNDYTRKTATKFLTRHKY